jgi:predicted nucleic acid-binding protein
MKLVIDANIIFALLIKEGKTSSIFFNLLLDLYSPEFVLEEIEKHKNEILNKTKRSEEEFYKIFKLIRK